MEIILLQDVEKLGLRGDVVDVARGYARNYLLPRRLAETATPAKVAELRRVETERAKHEARTAEQAHEIAELLGKTVLRFEVKAGPTGSLFGSVTPTDLADEIWRARKVRVDRRKIAIDPIKRIGRYTVPIELFQDVEVEVKTLVVPEGGELPPEEELAALEAAESEAAASAEADAEAEREEQQAEAEVTSKVHAIDVARQKVAEGRGTLSRAESQLHQVPVKQAEVARAEAALKQAQADLALAELQLVYTEVKAPTDGVVSKRSVEVGQVVQVGQPLLAIVPLHEVWVLANFKETQLARVRPGMKVEVQVDSYPGRTFTGVVDSISAGTGSRFSLLPPENATGNWVKVVQRVPVKILLDQREAGNPQPLRAGMSAVVTIKVE